MAKNYDHCESLYWVFTQLCNDHCDHCYNLSGPKGNTITEEDCMHIIDNLPAQVDRLILSGGEPLAERQKLYHILDKLKARYGNQTQIMLQTNGDLLTGPILDELIAKGVTRFDIASIDRYHKHKGQRLTELNELFASRNVNGDEPEPLVKKENYLHGYPLSWGHWGMDENLWLGGNWPRGRAYQKNIWKQDPSHNFCAIHSGAIGFLSGQDEIPQEISIQLWKINPCCPGTKDPLGDARNEKVADVLARVSDHPVFERLNKGDPFKMGESVGVSEAHARQRTEQLKSVCLWCDEFFTKHFDMHKMKPKPHQSSD